MQGLHGLIYLRLMDRKLFIGWMSNWEYAQKVPTEKWRSSMTIPRELSLVKENGHYRISSQPVRELKNYISKTIKKESLKIDKETIIMDKSLVDLSKVEIQFYSKGLKKRYLCFFIFQ